MNNHTQRILVAFVGIPLLVIASLIGGYIFLLTVICISTIALYEFYKLAELKGASPRIGSGLIAGICINISFFHDKLQFALIKILEKFNIFIPFPSQTQMLYIILTIIIIVFSLLELLKNKGSPVINLSLSFFGVLYIPLFLGTLVGIRELFVPFDFPVSRFFLEPENFTNPVIRDKIYQWGGYTVVSIFVIVWICDSAAYYIGSKFGKHKLYQRISPNKTWEGAVAGLIFAIASSVVMKYIFLDYLSLGSSIIIGIIIGVTGQAGDLFESMLKRDFGVKDSSSLIPGHGGMLDRFDSLIMVSPVIYLYFDFILFS